ARTASPAAILKSARPLPQTDAAPARARVDTEAALPLPGSRDLLSDLFGFVGLQRERPLPVRDRLSDVALLLGKVSQVLFYRRVVGLTSMRCNQVLLGLLKPPEPKVGPAKRVLERSVAGISSDGLFEKVAGRFEMHTAVRPHVAEIVLGRGIVGLDDEQLLKGLFR